MSRKILGNCACGEITFEIRALNANIVNCHCTTCRRLNGSAFSTYFVVADKCFEITTGEKLLARYSPSETAVKNFCSQCGSPVFNQNSKYPHLRMIHLGSLDMNETINPNVNIFCQSKLPWVVLDREIPCFEREIEP